MRDLSNPIYQLNVRDGDEVHTFYYRRPTNQEHVAYRASMFKRVKNKIISTVGQARYDFGKRVVTGFDKGTMCDGFNADGSPNLFSCATEDPDYRDDWKELIGKTLPDIFAIIGEYVFEQQTGIKSDSSVIDDIEFVSSLDEAPTDEVVSINSSPL
jgi:hypothetical protein